MDSSNPAEQAQQAVKTLMDSLNDWAEKTFSLGFWETIIMVGVVALVTFIVLRLLSHFLKKRLSGNLRIFYRLIYVLVIAVAVISVLMTINPLKKFATTVIASSGIAAVIIGLAAQETLGNLFSGISIGLSKPFLVGEYIEIVNMNVAGIVKAIDLRHTVIAGADGRHVVIPNAVLDKDMIVTSHNTMNPMLSNKLDIGVPYNTDVDLAMKIMADEVKKNKMHIDMRTPEQKENGAPEVVVRIEDFRAGSVLLRAFVWTKDTISGGQALADIRYAVKEEFDKNNITIVN